MKLVRTGLLRHIEAHSEKRVANMITKMRASGVWQRPICVERNHLLILDGQHRFEVARALGLSHVPCAMFDYDDEDLKVWSLHADCEVSKQLVIDRSLRGDIYPYKTAKHAFPRKVGKIMLTLEELSRRCAAAEGDIVDLMAH